MKRIIETFIFSFAVVGGICALFSGGSVFAASFCSHDYDTLAIRCEQYFPNPYGSWRYLSSDDKQLKNTANSATSMWPQSSSGTLGTRYCVKGVCAPIFPKVIETTVKTGEAGKDAICKGLGQNTYTTCADVTVAIKGKPARYEWGTMIRSDGSVPQNWSDEYWTYFYYPDSYKFSATYPCGFATKYASIKPPAPYYKPGQYVLQTLSVTANMPDKYNFHSEYLHLARGLMLCVLRTYTDTGAYLDNWTWLTPQWPAPATVTKLTANDQEGTLRIASGQQVHIDWVTDRATNIDVSSSQGDIPSSLIDDLRFTYNGGITGLAPVKDTTYTVGASNAGNSGNPNTKSVDVKIIPVGLDCNTVVLAKSGGSQVTVTWRPISADRVSVECATTFGRFCSKKFFSPGVAAVLDNVDPGDTVVTVIAYQGNSSTPACSPKIGISKEVNIIDVVVNGLNLGNVLLNSSLYELIAGQPCPDIPLVNSICSALSFNNIWRMAGSILTKLIPGLGDLVGIFVNFMKGPLVSLLGVMANLVDNFVIHHNTIQNLGTSITSFIGGFIKNFIPNFIAGAAQRVFVDLMGDCIGSRMGGWVNVGVQAVYNLFGQTLNLVGLIPGLGVVGDIGKTITDPCPISNSGCTIGTTVGQEQGGNIGKDILRDVVGTLIPGGAAFMDSALPAVHDFVEPIGEAIFPECKKEPKKEPQYIKCDTNVGQCVVSPVQQNYTKDQQAACDSACRPIVHYYGCDTSIGQCKPSTTPTLYKDQTSCDASCKPSSTPPLQKTGAGCGCPIHPEYITPTTAGANPLNVKRAVANAIMTGYYVVTSKAVPGGLCVSRSAAFACANSLYTNAQPIFASIFKIAQDNQGDLTQHINTISFDTFKSIFNGAATCVAGIGLNTAACKPELTPTQCTDTGQTKESDCQ